MPVLKGVITIKFSFCKIFTKIPTKEERSDFRKTLKPRFPENFDFTGFIVTFIKSIESEMKHSLPNERHKKAHRQVLREIDK